MPNSPPRALTRDSLIGVYATVGSPSRYPLDAIKKFAAARDTLTPSILYLTAASVRVGRCADGHAGGCTGGGVGIHGDGGGAKDAAHEYGGNVEELEKEGLK